MTANVHVCRWLLMKENRRRRDQHGLHMQQCNFVCPTRSRLRIPPVRTRVFASVRTRLVEFYARQCWYHSSAISARRLYWSCSILVHLLAQYLRCLLWFALQFTCFTIYSAIMGMTQLVLIGIVRPPTGVELQSQPTRAGRVGIGIFPLH